MLNMFTQITYRHYNIVNIEPHLTLPTPFDPNTWQWNTFLEVCFFCMSIFLSLVT